VQRYLLCSTRLAEALVRAHQWGVQVNVLLDAYAQPHYLPAPAVARLLAAGIAVSFDDRHEWAHDNVMVLDGEVVMTGSYNWTMAAEKDNSENLLVIRDSRLVEVYAEHWRRHAHHSMPYQGRIPWRTYIRVVWISLRRRRAKQ
jgi:phosphatidylserine/phosphatidylglycerophosphate/cardiolipin synthase-like enzyme